MMSQLPPRLRGHRAAALVAALTALAIPASAAAVALPDRTLRVSVTETGAQTDGASQDVAVSTDGRTIAFGTTASNFAPFDVNGRLDDIVAIDLLTGARRVVSENGDGPSVTPAMSGDGRVVAFTSFATNLVAGDVNGKADVFVRDGRKPPVLVSVGAGGAPANGASSQPDISADGRYVVFTSDATNLVGTDTNGTPDVFIRDLQTGTTRLVSASAGAGAPGDGRSSQPAISGNGRFVAFESAAKNLVRRDTNGIADVFVRDLQRSITERVSVSTKGRQQDRAVAPPFLMQPDISRDGRLVVFESDAGNLSADSNRRTDVFLHDRKRDVTRLISANSVNVQGDNDSFSPRIAPAGRYVAFQSFASNLVPTGDDGPREDVFVRDLRTGTTTVATATDDNVTRQRELIPQNLQRPALSNDATVVVFASTVPNLVEGDTNGVMDVFLRRLDPPSTRIVRPKKGSRVVRLSGDDARATRFLCQLDDRAPFACGATADLSDRPGRVLKARAGGPGMLFDPDGASLRLTTDTRRPTVRISQPRGRTLRRVTGRAADRGGSGVAYVEVAVTYLANTKGECASFDGKKFIKRFCTTKLFQRASGRRSFSLRLPKAIRGPILLAARSVDGAGNRSRIAIRRVVLI